MAFIESKETTTSFSNLFGPQQIKIYYTDEFTESRPSDLSYDSASGEWLPYLLAGYFYDLDINEGKWYFSNARMHDEMRKAVERNIGKGKGYVYGQIFFDAQSLREGRLFFERMDLHSNLPDYGLDLDKFIGVINPEFIKDGFYLTTIGDYEPDSRVIYKLDKTKNIFIKVLQKRV
jgi:hypothetical protein